MANRWSEERIWQWYHERPWLRGFNYLPSDCVSRIEFWQEHEHERVMKTVVDELKLAHESGFNSVRIILPFDVWNKQHDGFMERLDNFLSLADKNSISVMITFGNDCTVPKERYEPPVFGPQPMDFGYHSGRKNSPHVTLPAPGYSLLDEPELAELHYKMVAEIIGKYREDKRVVIFDLFNEIGNSMRETKSLPHLEKFFAIARDIDPIQPLTACVWRYNKERKVYSEAELRAIELSDIISWHYYGNYENTIKTIDRLKEYRRPLVNTEWLHRVQHNTVETIFPLFYLEQIACYNWGFVAGKSQTYQPWEYLWRRLDNGQGYDLDFTKWQHDLFRANHRPYDPHELTIIKEFTALADQRFSEKNSHKT